MDSRPNIIGKNLEGNNDFQTVYEAGKDSDSDTDALTNLVNNNIFIDVKDNRGLFTPAALLAAEGNQKAVLLLIMHGADPGCAAMGAAAAGHQELAELLKNTYGASVTDIALGAGMCENPEYAKQIAKESPQFSLMIIIGAARSNQTKYASDISEQAMQDNTFKKK